MRITLLTLILAAGATAQNNVKIENDFVRVLLARDAPGRGKGALHKHDRNRVMVYLDAGDIDIAWEGGKLDHQHWKAGQVAWSPAGGMHASENVSKNEIRIVEIELKKPPSGKPLPISKRDPLKI